MAESAKRTRQPETDRRHMAQAANVDWVVYVVSKKRAFIVI